MPTRDDANAARPAIETVVVDGLALAKNLRSEMAREIDDLIKAGKRAPCLVVVLVGDDPASRSYIKGKQRACDRIGMQSREHLLPESTPQASLLDLITQPNHDDGVDGILVQLPLPAHISESVVAEAVDPAKDCDALHPINSGRLLAGRAELIPCTPLGIMEILRPFETPLEGARASVIGRSLIVGKPISLLLQQANATVTMCHSRTVDLAEICRQSDVLVAAVGSPRLVKGDWVKPGATVIDVGINRIESHDGKTKLTGDVDFEAVRAHAGAITPVPGGVGPMTIACLLLNTLTATCRQHGVPEPDG